MAHYMEVSTKIYEIYLRYVSSEDIYVYSIDEIFIDVIGYLQTYDCTANELAIRMIWDVLNELNQAFRILLKRASDRPLVTVTYFQPDERKDGGEYVSYTGRFRFFDETERILHFTDRTEIPVDDVFHIEIK